jgi:DNA-binding GntR family transcriptional regulator
VIENAIIAGELPPGTVLRQEQLSERFAVSRTPVREALRQLTALGIVDFVPNRGVRVRELSRADLREAFLVRAELEGLAAELAAPRLSESDHGALADAERRFADLTHAVLQTSGTGDVDPTVLSDWFHANERFHDTILRAAGSPLLERMAKSVRRVFHAQAVWAISPEISQLYEENLLQHRAIREALAAGSPRGARALVSEHVIDSGHLLEAILSRLDPSLP